MYNTCYWCFNAKNLNIEFLFDASRRPRGLTISIIKDIIPERSSIHSLMSTSWMSALCQALRWPLTREQHGLGSSPLPKGSEIPKDKEGTRRNSKFSKFCSYEIALLDLKGRAGQSTLGVRGRARDWTAAATSHPQESGNLPRFWELLLLFYLSFTGPKRQRSGTNVKLLAAMWEWITRVKGDKILPT